MIMKLQTNEFPTPTKMKRTFAPFLSQILAGLMACLAFCAPAAVQVTRFDPPLQISAYADPSGDSSVNVLAVDFAANGVVDFNLGYGLGSMSAFFNAPVRFGQRLPMSNIASLSGPVAGVPLGSTIGQGIASSSVADLYVWSSGYTNRDDLTQTLGDHEATVIIANVVAFSQPQPQGSIIILTNGSPFTNIIYPHPIISGDVAYKNAVMALQFYIDGQPHYGYIHFDFSGGAGGVIYGWAYETEPNVPIHATSLAPVPAPPVDQTTNLHSGVVGMVEQGSLSGWTVSVSTATGTFVKSVQTDADGYFKADLAPGNYVLRPSYVPHPGPGQPVPNYILEGISKSVKVVRNQFRYVVLESSLGRTKH